MNFEAATASFLSRSDLVVRNMSHFRIL